MCRLIYTLYLCTHVAKDIDRCNSYRRQQCFPKFTPNPVIQLCPVCRRPPKTQIHTPPHFSSLPLDSSTPLPSPTTRQWRTGPVNHVSRLQRMKQQQLLPQEFKIKAKRMQSRCRAHMDLREEQLRRWFHYLKEWGKQNQHGSDDDVSENPEHMAQRETPYASVGKRKGKVKKELDETQQVYKERYFSWWPSSHGCFKRE